MGGLSGRASRSTPRLPRPATPATVPPPICTAPVGDGRRRPSDKPPGPADVVLMSRTADVAPKTGFELFELVARRTTAARSNFRESQDSSPLPGLHRALCLRQPVHD